MYGMNRAGGNQGQRQRNPYQQGKRNFTSPNTNAGNRPNINAGNRQTPNTNAGNRQTPNTNAGNKPTPNTNAGNRQNVNVKVKTEDEKRGQTDTSPLKNKPAQNEASNTKADNTMNHKQNEATVKQEVSEQNTDAKKSTGRCRLFVGNLPNDVNDEDVKKLFKAHGEIVECYLNTSRGFGFIRLDNKGNAEAAKQQLDGYVMRGRTLRVRFATHGAAIRVKYLPPTCSNELLEEAFSMFGNVERAVVIIDDRGKPTGEGIVEFVRKPGALSALKRIAEGVFLMGSHPRPITAEPLEQVDEEDGMPEKLIQKTQQYHLEREQKPRFAAQSSFEYSFGQKWKELYMVEEQQKEELKKQMEDAVNKLEMDMDSAMQEHQLVQQRQELMRKQEELRMLEERFAREQERKMRQREMGNKHQEDLFMQQQRAMREMRGERSNAPPMPPPPAPPAGMGIDRQRREGGSGSGPGGPMGGMDPQLALQQMMGMGGAGGDHNQQMRRSRFDQPPQQNMPQGFSSMGGGGPNSKDHQGHGSGNRPSGNNRDGGAAQPRGPPPSGPPNMGNRDEMQMMDRDRSGDRSRDDYFDNKRQRRF